MPSQHGWRHVGRIVVVAAAAGVAVVRLPAAPVERLYSNGVYAFAQPLLTTVSNQTRYALLDGLILVVAAAWLVQAVRDVVRSERFLRKIARILARTLVWSAALYLLFAAAWGLNYRRQSLVEKLAFHRDAVTADAARDMTEAAVDQANLLWEPAHSRLSGPGDAVEPELAAAFARAVESVGGSASIVVGRPKHSLLDWYFRRAAVSGMTDPIFLETLIATDVLAFERPFVTAHEWSHLAGIADEGEANFVGWLACVRGAAADRYSGWMFLYEELLPALDRSAQAAVAARLAPGPRADLRASRDRLLRNVNPRVAAAGWRVYDSYLKANRVTAGAASYADVVRLVLGVEFRDNWTPVRR
jgi:Protein of unknown function (DUF3810)